MLGIVLNVLSKKEGDLYEIGCFNVLHHTHCFTKQTAGTVSQPCEIILESKSLKLCTHCSQLHLAGVASEEDLAEAAEAEAARAAASEAGSGGSFSDAFSGSQIPAGLKEPSAQVLPAELFCLALCFIANAEENVKIFFPVLLCTSLLLC